MFARIQTHRLSDRPEGMGEAPLREFCDVLRMHPAYAGAYFLTDIVAATGALVTLWGNRADAERSSERTRERLGEPPFPLTSDRVLEVVDDIDGPASGTAGAAGIAEFDGPLPDERREEIERAGAGWVARAWAGAGGAIRMITMWDHRARATVVLNVAESSESLEAGGRAIQAAAAGQDPDRRADPDRVSVHRVDHADRGATVAG